MCLLHECSVWLWEREIPFVLSHHRIGFVADVIFNSIRIDWIQATSDALAIVGYWHADHTTRFGPRKRHTNEVNLLVSKHIVQSA